MWRRKRGALRRAHKVAREGEEIFTTRNRYLSSLLVTSTMKGRSRFIGGSFVGAEATERKARDEIAAARDVSGKDSISNGNDKPVTQKKSQTTVLSANAKELLAGREVTLNDIHDDVSSINDSIYMQAFGNEETGGSPKRPTTARSLLTGGLLYSAEEGSSADKPIKLLGNQDDDTDSLESGRSQSTAELKGKLNKLTSKYQMVDLDATVGLPSSSRDIPDLKSGENTGHRRRAPRWLYCAIVVIILSVIGAGVAIFLALSSKESNDDSNNFSISSSENSENKDSPNTQSVFTRSSPAPAPAPVRAPTPPPVNPPTLESIYTLLTSPPTASSVAEVIAVTEVPTEPPTEPPTASPTTASPITASPTRAPALEPSAFPTVVASDSPTVEPTTAFPTASPTIDITTRVVMYFTAGRIEDSYPGAMPHHLPQFPTRKGTSFLVHLGDWNNPDERCEEEAFQETSDIFANSSIPVYFVLGDADYNNCSDSNKSMELWKEYLMDFEIKHWDQPPWTVFRQGDMNGEYADFGENFMFTYAGGVFMSINLLMNGEVESVEEFNQRLEANLAWIDVAYNLFRMEAKSIFLFTHDAPNQANELFFLGLYDRLENLYHDMEFLLVHHTDTGDGGRIEKKYNDVKNLSVLAVEGTLWPPLQMTIIFRGGKPRIELEQNWETPLDHP